MTISPGPERVKLLSEFGPFADPALHGFLEAALERVVRLPEAYRIRQGLPAGLSGAARADLVEAWRETLFLMSTAISDLWDIAGSRDLGRGRAAELEMHLSIVRGYAVLLGHAALGHRLLPIPIAAFDLVDVSDWVSMSRDAMIDDTPVSGLLRSLPAWGDACFKRRHDPKWVSRVLKRYRERVEAHLGWIFGVTGARCRWASPHAKAMMARDVEWSKQWASKHFMVREDDGFIMPMQELIDASVRLRRAEDYALAMGLQSLAEEHGLHFVMATITLPGEFSPKVGNRSSVYNGASPAEANRALKGMMKRIRTNLLDTGDGAWKVTDNATGKKVRGSVCIGFCVTEPQETGVPHCHVMILTDDAARVEKIVLGYKVSAQHQIDVRRWHLSPSEGRAASIASYLTKYLMKGKDLDRGSDEALALAAWRRGAACRTTSWFGLGKGFKGRWRVVFRAEMTGEASKIKSPSFRAVRTAVYERKWGRALSLVADLASGGLCSDVPMVAWEPIREIKINRYDEPVKVITGYTLETGETVYFAIGEWELCEHLDLDGWDKDCDDGVEDADRPNRPPDRDFEDLCDLHGF